MKSAGRTVYRRQVRGAGSVEPDDGERALLKKIMRPFAGMGSVNDVALYKDGVVAVELNREFDALRCRLFDIVRAAL